MSQRPLALVTGASSGIGEQFARALSAKGYDLILVARRRDRLLSLSEELAKHNTTTRIVDLDLASASGVTQLCTVIDGIDQPIDLLINNAGVGSYGSFVDLPIQSELKMIDLNIRALVALTHHCLPNMVARKKGAIMQIASTAAFQATPYMATYGATKAFVLQFTEAIARELIDSGVRIVAICPGHTPTEFQERAGVHRRSMRTTSQSAEDLVKEALLALDGCDCHVVVTGTPNKFTSQTQRFLPRRLMSWIVARGFRPRA